MRFRGRAKHRARSGKRLAVIAVLLIAVIGGLAAGGLALYHRGYIQINNPSLKDYPVRGVDISGFQRTIDWPRLVDGSKLDFAFIKASEGSQIQDHKFRQNWSGARGLVARSAYHFFTFCSSGRSQATNFLDVLPQGSELPPAVDLEFSGNCTSYASIAAIRTQLELFLSLVRTSTHRRAILYVTSQSYQRIVRGHFDGYPLWVRDVLSTPAVAQYPKLLFWQYAGNGRAPGVKGLIDLNAFVGTKKQYDHFLRAGVSG